MCRSSTRVKEVFSDNSEVLDAVYIHDLANHRAGRNDSWLVTLQLNGQPVTFKMDTGADVTVIPMSVLRRQRETQEGNFRRNRRALVLMPKDQDERGGEISEEEETADEQGKRRVEDKRAVAEEEKQVDTEISNREPQDEEEKDEGEKHADTEISNREPQDEKVKGKGNLENPKTQDAKDPRMERQAPRMEPKEEHVIRTRSGRISRRPDYY